MSKWKAMHRYPDKTEASIKVQAYKSLGYTSFVWKENDVFMVMVLCDENEKLVKHV